MIVQPRRDSLMTELKTVGGGALQFANVQIIFVWNISGYGTGEACVYGTRFATRPTGGPCRVVRS